jgi:hypothetical protein
MAIAATDRVDATICEHGTLQAPGIRCARAMEVTLCRHQPPQGLTHAATQELGQAFFVLGERHRDRRDKTL